MSKETKGSVRTFHVFEKPVVVRSTDSGSKLNLYNQVKNFKGVFLDPYIIIADYDTKLVYVIEKGDLKNMRPFTPYDCELCYAKANPLKGSPLVLFGYDYQESAKALKIRFYQYNSLMKVKTHHPRKTPTRGPSTWRREAKKSTTIFSTSTTTTLRSSWEPPRARERSECCGAKTWLWPIRARMSRFPSTLRS